MHDQTIGSWLDDLASGSPAPGGGSAAALQAALGAALVSMVCNLTIGKPNYFDADAVMRQVLASATELRAQALELVSLDEQAFRSVSAAYKMPRDNDEEYAARAEAIQAALVGATEVPLRTAAVAAAVIVLAERIVAGANVNVISDVAVAAASARAALDSSAINVEVNLASLEDDERCEALRAELERHTDVASAADAVIREVQERIHS